MKLPSLPLQPYISGLPDGPARRGPKPKIPTERWFLTALEQLATGGIDSVRIEVVAERLGVTKGMFYARFPSRDAFLDAMIDYWRQRTTTGLVSELAALDKNPEDRLLRLFSIPEMDRARTGAYIEMAMRTWSLTDERPAKAMAEIDRHRLAYFEAVMVANGVPRELAGAKAFLVYSYVITDTLLPGDRSTLRDLCRAMLTGA
jgi:AcrR family transcriptional regulator